MADFDPPFAQSGERRLPTATERAQGFLCGPASQVLFNGMFHRIEAEIGEVIEHAGIVPTDERDTLLREAIEALIAAATGGGATGDYLLMTQARARLPIFPEILTADGKMGITSPATGQVRVPGNVVFQHRGIFRVTTVQTDFPTDASKTYHLRWNPTDGFAMKDLAGVTYNPTAAAETNVGFDSAYDDMLVARVITNSSNVPTVTNLVNRPRLFYSIRAEGPASVVAGNAGAREFLSTQTYNWARTPQTKAIAGACTALGVSGGAIEGAGNWVGREAFSRYFISARVLTDWSTTSLSGASGYLDFDLAA